MFTSQANEMVAVEAMRVHGGLHASCQNVICRPVHGRRRVRRCHRTGRGETSNGRKGASSGRNGAGRGGTRLASGSKRQRAGRDTLWQGGLGRDEKRGSGGTERDGAQRNEAVGSERSGAGRTALTGADAMGRGVKRRRAGWGGMEWGGLFWDKRVGGAERNETRHRVTRRAGGSVVWQGRTSGGWDEARQAGSDRGMAGQVSRAGWDRA